MTRKATDTLWYPLDALSTDWSKAGRRLGQASSAGCVVRGCNSMAFVALKTGTGNRAVCFRHYTQIDEVNATAR
jgi:hypothetical protein